jgi:hypothetical protein
MRINCDEFESGGQQEKRAAANWMLGNISELNHRHRNTKPMCFVN